MSKEKAPVICDFGVSKVLDEFGTVHMSTHGIGSYRWMAPEILNGRKFKEISELIFS